MHGEAASAPIQDLSSMRENLHQTLRDYDPKDIFNCDETGLFWKMKPSRTLSNSSVAGSKQSKDRVTILLTCNSTGTEKMRPLFIHKHENPRALKNINKNSLPVNYYWNKKSWMQVSIWNQYLKKLDAHMRAQKRNILLLVDNAPTHALYENTILTNIVIHHLSPNTTAYLQPCDQGIINSFKSQYRKLYLRNRVKTFDNFNEYGTEPVEINIKKCIKYVARAWDSVTDITINNCWKKANIMPTYNEEDNDENEILMELARIKELEEVQVLIDQLNPENPFTAEEFVDYDNSEGTTEMVSDEEILKAVLPNDQEKEEEIEEIPLPTITHTEAVESYDKVLLYLQQKEENFDSKKNDIKIIKKLKKEALKDRFISARQVNLNDFVNSM